MGSVLVGFSVQALVALVLAQGIVLWAAGKWLLNSIDRRLVKLEESFKDYPTRREMKLGFDVVHARIDPISGTAPGVPFGRRYSDPSSGTNQAEKG